MSFVTSYIYYLFRNIYKRLYEYFLLKIDVLKKNEGEVKATLRVSIQDEIVEILKLVHNCV